MASPETRTLIRHPLLWRPSAPAPLPPAPLSLSAAPPEVLRHVASYIDTARDLLSFGAVCTATRLVALDEALWKQLTLRTFPVPLCAAPPSPTPGWQGLFRFNHQVLHGVLLHPDLQAQLDAAYPRLWSTA